MGCMCRATPAESGKSPKFAKSKSCSYRRRRWPLGDRGGLGIKNSPPGGSVHWGVVGGCDPARAQTGGIFRAALAKSVNKLAKGRC
jgi:hypothetical protein